MTLLFHVVCLSVYLFGTTPTTDAIQTYEYVVFEFDASSPHRAVYEYVYVPTKL